MLVPFCLDYLYNFKSVFSTSFFFAEEHHDRILIDWETIRYVYVLFVKIGDIRTGI